MSARVVQFKGAEYVVTSQEVEVLLNEGKVKAHTSALRVEAGWWTTGGIQYHGTEALTVPGHWLMIDTDTVFRGKTTGVATLREEANADGWRATSLKRRWNESRSQSRAGKIRHVVQTIRAMGPEMLEAYKRSRKLYYQHAYMEGTVRVRDDETTKALNLLGRALKGTRARQYLAEVVNT